MKNTEIWRKYCWQLMKCWSDGIIRSAWCASWIQVGCDPYWTDSVYMLPHFVIDLTKTDDYLFMNNLPIALHLLCNFSVLLLLAITAVKSWKLICIKKICPHSTRYCVAFKYSDICYFLCSPVPTFLFKCLLGEIPPRKFISVLKSVSIKLL